MGNGWCYCEYLFKGWSYFWWKQWWTFSEESFLDQLEFNKLGQFQAYNYWENFSSVYCSYSFLVLFSDTDFLDSCQSDFKTGFAIETDSVTLVDNLRRALYSGRVSLLIALNLTFVLSTMVSHSTCLTWDCHRGYVPQINAKWLLPAFWPLACGACRILWEFDSVWNHWILLLEESYYSVTNMLNGVLMLSF